MYMDYFNKNDTNDFFFDTPKKARFGLLNYVNSPVGRLWTDTAMEKDAYDPYYNKRTLELRTLIARAPVLLQSHHAWKLSNNLEFEPVDVETFEERLRTPTKTFTVLKMKAPAKSAPCGGGNCLIKVTIPPGTLLGWTDMFKTQSWPLKTSIVLPPGYTFRIDRTDIKQDVKHYHCTAVPHAPTMIRDFCKYKIPRMLTVLPLYARQIIDAYVKHASNIKEENNSIYAISAADLGIGTDPLPQDAADALSLIQFSEPTRPY